MKKRKKPGMPENNFENKVQKLMDELKFKPSEEVWSAINKRIQRKRRRKFIFFLLPLLSALFVTGYIFYKNNNQPVVGNSTVQTPVKIKTGGSEKISNPASIQPVIENGDAGNSINEKTNPVSSKQNTNQPLADKNFITHSQPDENLKKPVQSDITDSPKEISLTGRDLIVNNSDEKTIASENDNDEELTQLANGHLNFTKPITLDNNPVQVLDNSLTPNSESRLRENVFDAEIIMPDLNLKNQVVENASSKWKLGFHVTAGSSKTGGKAIPGIQGENVAMDFSNAPNAGGSLYGGPIYIRPPQKAEAGVSVEVGIVLQKQFTDRSSMMVGLQYFYANDQLLAGTQYNNYNQLQFASSSSLSRYYSGNDAWYTNHYHFIELPFQYGYLLNKKSNVPVRLHAGIILSQLISTNGVIYDPALTGIYFHERKQFNNTGLSLCSGMSVSFNQNKKLKWSVGPQVRAGLTSLRKPSYDHNKYLISGGLQFKLFID